MKPIVCILANKDRSYSYGIGRYLEQIINYNNEDFSVLLILLSSYLSDIQIIDNIDYNIIEIPVCNIDNSSKQENRFGRGMLYFLKEEYIKDNKCIFHINTYCSPYLIQMVKEIVKSRVIFTFHSPSWAYSDLLGNESLLLEILQKEEAKRTASENKIVDLLKKDIELISYSDKIVFIANHTLWLYNKIYDLPKDKCEVVYNGLKDSYTCTKGKTNQYIRRKFGLSFNERIIIFVGRLDYIKGISFLIDAYLKIVNKIPQSRLLIVGDGKYFQSVESKHITFMGFVNESDLNELYRIADMGIILSLYEEFGYVAIEMMMHKLPIIATDTTGLSEIIENNITGVKIPVKYKKTGEPFVDTNYVAEKMVQLIKDDDNRLFLASNARRVYKQKFSDHLFMMKMKNVYIKTFNTL